MEIKTIVYKRTKNLVNFNSESLEMGAEIGIDEDVDQCVADLRNRVETKLGLVKKAEPKPAPAPENFDEKPF